MKNYTRNSDSYTAVLLCAAFVIVPMVAAAGPGQGI